MTKKEVEIRMDLDGTSVKSEEFWISRIEKTRQVVSQNSSFRLTKEDFPFVSGFTTQEHLSYCLNKYKIPVSVNRAQRRHKHKKEEYSKFSHNHNKIVFFKRKNIISNIFFIFFDYLID